MIFPSGVEYENQRDRPKALQIQVSRAVVTNVRCATESRSSLAELARCVDACQMAALLNEGADFPGKPADMPLATEKLLRHVAGECRHNGDFSSRRLVAAATYYSFVTSICVNSACTIECHKMDL